MFREWVAVGILATAIITYLNHLQFFRQTTFMSQPIVSIKKLSHRYTNDWAIKDINLEVRKDEILGLLGSNGAGKSTTMNILCGILSHVYGEVSINGIDIRKKPTAAKKLLGFLPQKAPLYPEFSVKNYLEYAGQLRLMSHKEITKSIGYVMERCGIAHFRNRLIGNLSGGYQQRVGIAQAIIHRPLLVVLDEPTNGLDPVQVLEVRKLIKELGQDHAIILSTHILSEVDALCDNVDMIEKGKMVFSGSLDEYRNQVKTNTLILKLNSRPDMAVLNSLEGIESVVDMQLNRFRINFSNGRDISEQVQALIRAHGWGLEEIYFEQSSLNDVFAKISTVN